LDDTLRAKQKAYGPFEDGAQLAQALKFAMRRGKNWDNLPMESKEAIEMICTMLSRIGTGDASDPKLWNAAAGFFRLRANALGSLEGAMATIAQRLRQFPRPIDSPDESA
jgi:hypothetical protein